MSVPVDRLADELRLLRMQLGELARILAPSGYLYDPAIQDETDEVQGDENR